MNKEIDMYLADTNNALDHKIIGGSEYCWESWDNARYLDYESDHAHASVVFNTETQEIYSAEINDKLDQHKPYRWLNPKYKESHVAESKERDVDYTMAWDNKKWVDLETSDDWLAKAKAIMNNEAFDDRVEIPLDLDDDLLLKLFLEAHKRDITLNQMVEIILKKVIDEHE